MIYLLGVDHKIQHDGPLGPKPERTEAFVDAVTEMIKNLSIEVVVEEYNEDAKREDQITLSVLEKVARAMGVKHVFCEPSLEERKANGILKEGQIIKKHGFDELRGLTNEQKAIVEKEVREQFAKREALWYSAIEEDIGPNMLCVIGASHVPTFGSLLRKRGQESEVLSENWCVENFT